MQKSLFAIPCAALLLAGCGTQSTYVDPAGSKLVTNVGQANIQDFAQAADSMVQSLIDNLINQGKLHSGMADQPALLAISRITNQTGQHFDTDILIKKIRIALLRTGKVQTSTVLGLGGAEDPLAAENLKTTRLADYTLSGKIMQERARAGDVRQSAFIFQLTLSSPAGIAVWEEEKTIVKQGTQPSVGF